MLFTTIFLLAFAAVYIGSLIIAALKKRIQDGKELNDIERLLQDSQQATKSFAARSAKIEKETI